MARLGNKIDVSTASMVVAQLDDASIRASSRRYSPGAATQCQALGKFDQPVESWRTGGPQSAHAVPSALRAPYREAPASNTRSSADRSQSDPRGIPCPERGTKRSLPQRKENTWPSF